MRPHMLEKMPLQLNLVTTDMGRAKTFYTKTLGMRLAQDMGEAAFLESGGQTLFLYQRAAPPKADHTVASFAVPDIKSIVKELAAKGVKFERYEGFDQDALGISSRTPEGPHAAWFKDPDGNILAITQFPARG